MASLGGRWRTWIGFIARRYGPAEEGGAFAFWPCSSRDPVGFLGATVVDGSGVVVVVGGSVVVVVVGSVVEVVVGSLAVTAADVVVDGEPAGTGPGAAVAAGGTVVLRLGVSCWLGAFDCRTAISIALRMEGGVVGSRWNSVASWSRVAVSDCCSARTKRL